VLQLLHVRKHRECLWYKTTHFGHSAKRKCCSCSTRESTTNTSSKNKLTLGTAQNASAAAAPRERAPRLIALDIKNNSLWAQRKTQVLQLLHVREHQHCMPLLPGVQPRARLHARTQTDKAENECKWLTIEQHRMPLLPGVQPRARLHASTQTD